MNAFRLAHSRPRLVLVRHGKAERESSSGLDFDRELTERGRAQAAFLAERLREVLQADQAGEAVVVHSSRAARARQTAEPIAAALGAAVQFDERLLVDEPSAGVLDMVSALMRQPTTLVVAGHNPQLSRVACLLLQGASGWAGELDTGQALVLLPASPGVAPGSADDLVGAFVLQASLRLDG